MAKSAAREMPLVTFGGGGGEGGHLGQGTEGSMGYDQEQSSPTHVTRNERLQKDGLS
jgi:hypothetical protein